MHISFILFGHLHQPVEGSNEFLQLLKSHKEKLEVGLVELRKRNEELEKEKAESDKEKEALRLSVDQLQTHLAQLSLQVTQLPHFGCSAASLIQTALCS